MDGPLNTSRSELSQSTYTVLYTEKETNFLWKQLEGKLLIYLLSHYHTMVRFQLSLSLLIYLLCGSQLKHDLIYAELRCTTGL